MFQNCVFSIGRFNANIYYASGTCTLINKAGLMATAAHVVDGNDDNLWIRLNTNDINDFQDTTVQKSTFLPVKIKAIDPLRDLCVVSLMGQDNVQSTVWVSSVSNVFIGEAVTVVGFPHSNLGRIVLTQQTCEIGAKIILGASGIKSKHLVLNIQARPGQSGGPVIRKVDGSLIAVLIGAYVPSTEGGISLGGIDPQTLHQTTHAVSAEYLERML